VHAGIKTWLWGMDLNRGGIPLAELFNVNEAGDYGVSQTSDTISSLKDTLAFLEQHGMEYDINPSDEDLNSHLTKLIKKETEKPITMVLGSPGNSDDRSY